MRRSRASAKLLRVTSHPAHLLRVGQTTGSLLALVEEGRACAISAGAERPPRAIIRRTPERGETVTSFLEQPSRYLFFTGKGGVGKTALACATAIRLADAGKRVLLVSTDPASNLDEMLGVSARQHDRRRCRASPGLSALNIDPEKAADDVPRARDRPVSAHAGPTPKVGRAARAALRRVHHGDRRVRRVRRAPRRRRDDERRSTTSLFDTAPTGHTLRLLSLPRGWTGFLRVERRTARSCLGPHSGLKMQQTRFAAAVEALGDPASAPPSSSYAARRGGAARGGPHVGRARGARASRTSASSSTRVFEATDRTDPVAVALEQRGREALREMPASAAGPAHDADPAAPLQHGRPAGPARACSTIARPRRSRRRRAGPVPALPPLASLIDDIAAPGHGLVMVMGKGGVGKTTIAAAIAVGAGRRAATPSTSAPPTRRRTSRRRSRASSTT